MNRIYANKIDATYITTGTLTDKFGNYSLDMDTGKVNMASANISGGSISIDTEDGNDDAISLNYEHV